MALIHKFVLLLVAALTLVLASPTSDTLSTDLLTRAQGEVNLGCGTHASQSAIAAAQSKLTLFASSYSHKPRQIRIYWHVIYDAKTFDKGYLTDEQIRRQVRALNTHFQSADISFKLEKIDRTQKSDWFYSITPTDGFHVQMREALHKGGREDLNIYSVFFQNLDFGGYSTWPWDVKSAPKLDGVVLTWLTIPGGPWTPYNQGKILVHQVGHWCGLFHTFEGGCTEPSDFVSDTPLQSFPYYGCPIDKDTCPGGGKDPIHNFMSFTDDSCKTHFTKGQGALMRHSLAMWRHNP
ncbi:hypothetical protein BDV93DRAFT_610753 [Ceratobasidium sp. AG-I]|nr:hypothetical protein BDV93DRAFT_610753 [Ceratobasidium sp. AG-I]